MLHVVHLRMIFKRFQMGGDLRGHFHIRCEALLKYCCQPVGFAQFHRVRKQQVNLLPNLEDVFLKLTGHSIRE